MGVITLLSGCVYASEADEGPLGPVYPLPSGFDYPQSAQNVQQWVNARDGLRMRAHSWYLWAGLNQPSTSKADAIPVWRSWNTATQAFSRDDMIAPHDRMSMKARNEKNAGDNDNGIILPGRPEYVMPNSLIPITKYGKCINYNQADKTYSLKQGKLFQNNGDVMVAGVIYNQPAFNHIRQNMLYKAEVLQTKLPAVGQPAEQIPDFPAESIVLKPMMWPVKGDGYTALPVWTQNHFWPPTFDIYSGYEVQYDTVGIPKWSRAVAVTSRSNPVHGEQDVEFLVRDVYKPDNSGKRELWGPNKFKNAKVVSIDDFYHVTYSKSQLESMDPCDRAIIDQSAIWSYGRQFREGDSLILIAMHIMTKEQPVWTFQTVWWSDRPEVPESDYENRFAVGRPAELLNRKDIKGPWNHYLMANTFGSVQLPNMYKPDAKPRRADPRMPFIWPTDLGNPPDQPGKPGTTRNSRFRSKLPVIYNPYIELVSHPIKTNCMNCHMRAAWPPDPNFNPFFPNPPKDRPRASYLADPIKDMKGFPDSLDAMTFETEVFDSLLMLDSLWSVSDRAH